MIKSLKKVYESVEEAVKELNLDKRHKWYNFYGEVVYNYKYSHPCSGCTENNEMTTVPKRGLGCDECGYSGRRRSVVPVPAFRKDGNIVKVKINKT